MGSLLLVLDYEIDCNKAKITELKACKAAIQNVGFMGWLFITIAMIIAVTIIFPENPNKENKNEPTRKD